MCSWWHRKMNRNWRFRGKPSLTQTPCRKVSRTHTDSITYLLKPRPGAPLTNLIRGTSIHIHFQIKMSTQAWSIATSMWIRARWPPAAISFKIQWTRSLCRLGAREASQPTRWTEPWACTQYSTMAAGKRIARNSVCSTIIRVYRICRISADCPALRTLEVGHFSLTLGWGQAAHHCRIKDCCRIIMWRVVPSHSNNKCRCRRSAVTFSRVSFYWSLALQRSPIRMRCRGQSH